MKDLEERKVVFNTALELYNNLLRICETQYDKLPKAKKKKIKVQNVPENLSIALHLDEDDSPLESDEEVKLEPAKTIAERVKLNPLKRKNE